jgi:kynurenine formamidase
MSWIYLSHVLDSDTPLYGGGGTVSIVRTRRMDANDTSNNSSLALPAHSGTHVDAPFHFDPQGLTLDRLPAHFWRAASPSLIDAPCNPGELLDLDRLGPLFDAIPHQCDLLLLRTGAEAWRSANPDTYACQGPGLAPAAAAWLRENRRLRFLGMDFISLSSPLHREAGRAAHRALLGPASASAPVLLIEDMALGELKASPLSAWIMPLLYRDADGAPATVIAEVA